MKSRVKVLLDDPAGGPFPAVVQAGDLVFLSSVDGDFDYSTGDYDRASFGDGPHQARNAYGELVRRMNEIGLTGRSLVRVENATASQDWRLDRMALWPEYFGTPTHAVSQGYQAKLRHQNLISVAAIATTKPDQVQIIRAGPNNGRAARINRVGPFLFVIGVRGEEDLATGQKAEELTDGAFEQQVTFAYRNLENHLQAAGASVRDLVRVDCFIRDINRAMDHRDYRTAFFGGRMNTSSTVVACPLGGRSDIEISGIALEPSLTRDTTFYEGRRDLARTVRAGGLVFASGALGNRGVDGKLRPEVCGDLRAQLDLALARLEASLADYGVDMTSAVRLDLYLKDPYLVDEAINHLAVALPGQKPALVVHGIDLEPTAETELTVIAAAKDDLI